MKTLAHIVTFYGKPGTTSITGYHSNNLRIIDAQLDLMQQAQYGGVIALWYGAANAYINDACEKICFLCEKRKMLFGLCFDPWAMIDKKASVQQKNDTFLKAVDLASWMMKSSTYLPEKYILDFETGADIPVVQAQLGPKATILRCHKEFAWQKSAQSNAKDLLLQENQTAVIPGVIRRFFDGGLVVNGTPDYNQSVWGGPVRKIDGKAGNLYLDLVDGIAQRSNPPAYVQDITWNDYFEGTACETEMADFFGVRLVD